MLCYFANNHSDQSTIQSLLFKVPNSAFQFQEKYPNFMTISVRPIPTPICGASYLRLPVLKVQKEVAGRLKCPSLPFPLPSPPPLADPDSPNRDIRPLPLLLFLLFPLPLPLLRSIGFLNTARGSGGAL